MNPDKSVPSLNELGIRALFSPARLSIDNTSWYQRTIGRFGPIFNSSQFRIHIELDKDKVLKHLPDFDFESSSVDINIMHDHNGQQLLDYNIHVGAPDFRYQSYKQETTTHYKYTVIGFLDQCMIYNRLFTCKWSKAYAYLSLDYGRSHHRATLEGSLSKVLEIEPEVLGTSKLVKIPCYGDTFIERHRDYRRNLRLLINTGALNYYKGKWFFHNQFS